MLICYSVCFGNSFLTFVLSQICLNLTKHNFDWLILAISDLIVFLIKDALSILTLWMQSRRGILVQTSPKNSSRTMGKCFGGYGLCKFPYLRMSPLYLIYGLNFRRHDCTISFQFCVIDYLFKFPKWWLRIKFLVKGHNSSLYLSYSMMTGIIFSKRSLSVRKMEAIIGTKFLKNPLKNKWHLHRQNRNKWERMSFYF